MKIGYMMSRFPKLSETFILNEMVAMRELGVDIHVFPLLRGGEPVRHPEAASFGQVHYCDGISIRPLTAHFRWFFRKPSAYIGAWAAAIGGNITSPGFLSRALAVMYKAPFFALEVERLGIERIHAHWATHPALCAMVVKRLSGTPFSITAHAHDLFVERPMLRRKIRESEVTITISDFNKRLIEKLYGTGAAAHVEVVRLGVDLRRFEPPARLPDPPPFRMICIASLEEYKGHGTLVSACAILAEKRVPFVCDCIGEGTRRRDIEEMIRQKGLSGRIRLDGAKPWEAVRAALAVSNCIVMPSIIDRRGKTEGIPVSLMEGLAMKLPAVASELSGIPELIEHGKNGFLVAAGDPAELAESIETLYRNPKLARSMGEQGRRTIEKKHDLSRNVKRLYDLIAR